MAKEIMQKSVLMSSNISIKEVEGERRIVFVASSNHEDRHYESVNVESLRLPLKGGGFVVVGSIAEAGIENISIPFVLNHESWDIGKQIGSIRKAWYKDGELIFEAGISSIEIAQTAMTLIDEGHIDNSFSLGMRDYDYNMESETISNAEVFETSLVVRGANKEARLIAIKSLDGEKNMSEANKQNDTFGDANGDGKEHGQSKPVETPKEEKPAKKPKTTKKEVEAEEVENAVVETVDETVEDIKEEEKEEAMNKTIAKDTVIEKNELPVQANKSVDYLKTKAALADFKEIVVKSHRGTNDQIMKTWAENLKEKGITGDAILPARIENIFFKAWEDTTSTPAFRILNVRVGSVYAMNTEDTAKAHTKGETKETQEVEAIRRDLKAICMYKKLPIDLQDLFDDQTGELLAFRAEELANRVANQIIVTALLGGEGAQADNSGRGLYPIVTDIAATTGFGGIVATSVDYDASDSNYAIAVKTLGAVSGNGKKVLFVPTGFKTEMLLTKDTSGAPLFPIGTNLDILFQATIQELDELVGADYKAIAVAEGAYVVVGEANPTVRTDFDLTVNQDVMLVERFVGGSLAGRKVAAGYNAS